MWLLLLLLPLILPTPPICHGEQKLIQGEEG